MKNNLRFLKKILLTKLTKKLLGKYTYALTIKTNNGYFMVDPRDNEIGNLLKHTGEYGNNEITKIKAYLNKDSKVLIVGTHIGTLLIPISKLCKEITGIEANPDTYNLLQLNLNINNIENARIFNIAANDKIEDLKFLLNIANTGGSKRVPNNKEYMYYYDNPKEIIVKSYPLDIYLKNEKFDLILMDIEGSEYFALKGMERLISNTKVLIIEFVPHHLKNVANVTVEEFLSLLIPYFSKLIIPSKKSSIQIDEALIKLKEMYDANEVEDGLIFLK